MKEYGMCLFFMKTNFCCQISIPLHAWVHILTNNSCTSVNPCSSRSSESAEKSSFRCVSAKETITRHKPLEVSCHKENDNFTKQDRHRSKMAHQGHCLDLVSVEWSNLEIKLSICLGKLIPHYTSYKNSRPLLSYMDKPTQW